MAGGIFLNYRRLDDPGHAGRLYDNLRLGLSDTEVYMDVEGFIELGDEVADVIARTVADCDIFLAVIGPRWLTELEARAGDPTDFVVLELEAALRAGKRVIPVLVGGAKLPAAVRLPESIQSLAGRNAATLRAEQFPADCERLVRQLAKLLAALAVPGRTQSPSPGRQSSSSRPDIEVPGWAVDAGRDRYGMWADLQVGGVVARMRYIQPGSFMMGSPPSEPGRVDDEGPQHQVSLSRGYWLGDAPCTQALWEAVRGGNLSYFKSPERPVEQVSWNDCQKFLARLNRKVPGLDGRLPTEAEWEYACRAGSTEATYAGPLEILGDCNGPVLDAIAWYSGNSGVDFDLEEGYDSAAWPDKQYAHTVAGTRLVKQKDPNVWGLYDMLGNVCEWCSDWFGEYSSVSVSDPAGPKEGQSRVIRGGSWGNYARFVRAAFRGRIGPGGRFYYLGFRLARGHQE